MPALLIDPHGDDAVLFACFTAIREQPHVLVTHRTVPSEEVDAAMNVLGLTWSEGRLAMDLDLVILPAAEEGGHAEHNQANMFTWSGVVETTEYLTYAPRGHRSVWGREVKPTPQEIAFKLEALSKFQSQIEQPSTRPWFFELLDLREWVR